jgi:hypothetical protein
VFVSHCEMLNTRLWEEYRQYYRPLPNARFSSITKQPFKPPDTVNYLPDLDINYKSSSLYLQFILYKLYVMIPVPFIVFCCVDVKIYTINLIWIRSYALV